jgi:hypothetical protein
MCFDFVFKFNMGINWSLEGIVAHPKAQRQNTSTATIQSNNVSKINVDNRFRFSTIIQRWNQSQLNEITYSKLKSLTKSAELFIQLRYVLFGP